MRDHAVSGGGAQLRIQGNRLRCGQLEAGAAAQKQQLSRLGGVENGQQDLCVFSSIQTKAGQVTAIG